MDLGGWGRGPGFPLIKPYLHPCVKLNGLTIKNLLQLPTPIYAQILLCKTHTKNSIYGFQVISIIVHENFKVLKLNQVKGWNGIIVGFSLNKKRNRGRVSVLDQYYLWNSTQKCCIKNRWSWTQIDAIKHEIKCIPREDVKKMASQHAETVHRVGEKGAWG